MTTPDPTLDNIAKVKSNLANMQAFNDYVYNNGGAYIANCFLLMTSKDESDPGLVVGMSLLEGAFGVVASFGAFGGFAGCYMCGEVSSWVVETPPDLNSAFASMDIRFQHSSMAFDNNCATYMADPEAYWDKSFSWQGQSILLADLSTIDFPKEDDPEFFDMASAALKALDVTIWKTILQEKCWITLWTYNGGPEMQSADTNMVSWDEQFISRNPAWYNTWYWHSKKGMFDKDWWYVNKWNLNFGATHMHTNDIPTAACAYLFIDSADGIVINPVGLSSRRAVFEQWGIRTSVLDS